MDGERDESEGEGGDSDGKDEAEGDDVPKRLQFHPEEFEMDRIDPEKPTRDYSTAQRTAVDELQDSIRTAVEGTADRVARQTDKSRLTSRGDLENVGELRKDSPTADVEVHNLIFNFVTSRRTRLGSADNSNAYFRTKSWVVS